MRIFIVPLFYMSGSDLQKVLIVAQNVRTDWIITKKQFFEIEFPKGCMKGENMYFC